MPLPWGVQHAADRCGRSRGGLERTGRRSPYLDEHKVSGAKVRINPGAQADESPRGVARLAPSLARLGTGNRPAIILLLLGLVIGLLIVTDYGVSIDEPRNADVGRDALKAYSGDSDYFLHDHLADHGPAYFMFFYATSKALVHIFSGWLIPDGRHFTNYVTFLAGLYFFYLICLRLVRQVAALATTALFATQPLLFGSAFINQKDIPFMVLFLGVIVLGLAAGDHEDPLRVSSEQSPRSFKKRLIAFGQRTGSDWRALPARKRRVLVFGSVLGLLLLLDLFLVGTVDRLGRSTVIAAFNGQAPWPIQTLFSRIATDAFKTPLPLYLDRYNTVFAVTRILITTLLAAVGLLVFSTALPGLGDALKGNWPGDRYPPLLLGAVLLGFAVCVRQIGFFAGGLVSIYLAYRGRQKAALPLILYWAIALLVTFATWPYLWPDPIPNMLSSFAVIQEFGEYTVLFRGQVYFANTLPWYYLPTLLGLQLTEPSLVLIALGAGVATCHLAKGSRGRVIIGLLVVWAGAPVLWLIFHGVPIYTSIRHFLFVLPPLFILSSFSFDAILKRVRRPALAVLVLVIILGPGLWGIAQLHPYEYGYFNSLIGGVSGAGGDYEIDYWCTSVKEATEFIDQAAENGDVLRVLGPVQNVLPYARDDLVSSGFRGAIATADWVLVCPLNLHHWDSSDFELAYQVRRGSAVLAEVWRRPKVRPPTSALN